MFHSDQLSPEGDRIRDNQIRPDLPDILRRHLIQSQRRGDEQFCGKRLILADPVGVLLVLHLEVISITGNKGRACPLDLIPEHLEGEVIHLMTGFCQLFHKAKCRVGMPVGRNTEPCDLHNSISSRIGVWSCLGPESSISDRFTCPLMRSLTRK